MRNFLMIYGTRPEAIKLAPLISEMRKHPKKINLVVCNMGQHIDLIQNRYGVNSFMDDLGFKIMIKDQSIFYIISKVTIHVHEIFDKIFRPDAVIVQGDTTTAFAAALASFNLDIPVIHIEAGLRTGNIKNPYPEEFNRTAIDLISSLHFTPTQNNKKQLLHENKRRIIRVVGNTVIDALDAQLKKIEKEKGLPKREEKVVVTIHRRESFPKLKEMFKTIVTLSGSHPNYQFVIVRHPNPNVEKAILETRFNTNNVLLLPPLDYTGFLELLISSTLVMTDSGGIVEEAPTLGLPVVILREVTERMEAVKAGCAVMAGTDIDSVFYEVDNILNNEDVRKKMAAPRKNPFGDGTASKQISKILSTEDFRFLPKP